MDKAVTDFPEPLSPTIARVSPLKTSKLLFLTALINLLFISNSIPRFLIFNIGFIYITFLGSNASLTASPINTRRLNCIDNVKNADSPSQGA